MRFAFGDNWSRFLSLIDVDRIRQAEESLLEMLGVGDLRDKRFLDVGSGSGLFSLAARRLGAKVHSFDCDPESVECTMELKRRFFPEDAEWTIEQGSVLDREYLSSLGPWDVVYSWGVLHHTGKMSAALENVTPLVAPRGQLFLAIYNDQGRASGVWLRVKRAYNRLPRGLRWLILWPAAVRLWGPTMLRVAGLGLILVNRIDREEAVMIEQFGDTYRDYMKRTGRFLPRLRALSKKVA